MAKKFALFATRTVKKKGGSSSAIDRLPVERLWELGPKAVENMNRSARHPNIPPAGSDSPLIYVLSGAPTKEDDREGEHFAGARGRLFRGQFRGQWRSRIRYNYCCPTLPPAKYADGPNRVHLECFRPSVVEDIEKAKPQVILAVGKAALDWFIPKAGGVGLCRGRRFPVKVGSHTCWMQPVFDPAYVIEMQDFKGGRQKAPGEEYRKLFVNDIKCLQIAIEKDELGTPRVEDSATENLYRGVSIFRPGKGTVDSILAELKKFSKLKSVACDFETTQLRPYKGDGHILTMSVGTLKKSIAFTVDHPKYKWSRKEYQKLHAGIRDFFRTKSVKVWHNLSFDLEWLVYVFGIDMLRASRWACSMQQAYIIDERQDGHSLDFLVRRYFGLDLKIQSGVDRANLLHEDVDRVLLYNTLDSKYTHPLYLKQKKIIKRESLTRIYREQVRRIPALVAAQLQGFPVSSERVRELRVEYEDKVKDAEKAIFACKGVKEFTKRYGSFEPHSPQQVIKLFKDVLGKGDKIKKGTKYSSDEKSLKAVGGKEANAILDLRTATKMLSTYIGRLLPEHPETYIYPDGRLHTSFNACFTRSGRLSSNDPNMQNYPKRSKEGKRVRQAMAAPPGWRIISADYGQMEARVIGMHSHDKVFCHALWNNYDVHMEWAEKVARVYDKTIKSRYGSLDGKAMKAFRGDIKNQLVFPAFYGSQARPIAGALEMPIEKLMPLYEEFWSTFRGVKKWQNRMERFYNENGYVQGLAGRRRRAPLSFNMIVNTPIQGDSSDIVVNAMSRLSELAYETDRPWLSPVLNIHDDLTFLVPVEHEDEAIEELVLHMCKVPFEWVNTPILIEVESGDNWGEMSEVGAFSSDELFNLKMPKEFKLAA